MIDRAAQFLADVLASSAALREAIGAGVPQDAADLVRGRSVLVAGMGSSRFAALGALPHLRAAGVHVGLYTMLPGGRALLLAGSPDDDEVVSTVAGRGGRRVVIGPAVEGAAVHVPLPERVLEDSVVRSLVKPAAVELIAAELWPGPQPRADASAGARRSRIAGSASTVCRSNGLRSTQIACPMPAAAYSRRPLATSSTVPTTSGRSSPVGG